MRKLTEKEYWDENYRERTAIQPVKVTGSRSLCNARILEIKERYASGFESALEIGGGGSSWLGYLAKNFPQGEFAALDYSDDGARLLEDFIRLNSLRNVRVYCRDFFEPNDEVGRHQFVYSHGVVEHFADLAATLRAHARFMNSSGKMFTLIPNLAGVLGPLTKWMDKSVYDIHVAHDLASFVEGHDAADLRVVDSGYLCSVNFSVLSSCVRDHKGLKWSFYKLLSRISKAVWFLEHKLTNFPATRRFSPYIYVVSEHRRDA